MRDRVLVIGMSHIAALARAASLAGRRDLVFININDKAYDLRVTPDARQAVIDRVGRIGVVCLSVAGNHHNLLSLVRHPTPFYIHPAAPGGWFIPRDMLLAHMRQRHENVLVAERAIVEMFPQAQRLLVAPPPPAGDAAHVTLFPGVFAPTLARGVSPDDLRIAVYDLQVEIYAEHAQALGAELLLSPVSARDDSGKLARRYWASDPTHGNADYGRFVLDQIDARVRRAA